MPGSLEQVLLEVGGDNLMDKENFVGMGAQAVVVAVVREGVEADNPGIETVMPEKDIDGELAVESVEPVGRVVQPDEHKAVVEVH